MFNIKFQEKADEMSFKGPPVQIQQSKNRQWGVQCAPPHPNPPASGPDRAKAFNMITNKNEATAMTEQISCDCKFKFNSTTCNSKQKLNNKATKHVNVM